MADDVATLGFAIPTDEVVRSLEDLDKSLKKVGQTGDATKKQIADVGAAAKTSVPSINAATQSIGAATTASSTYERMLVATASANGLLVRGLTSLISPAGIATLAIAGVTGAAGFMWNALADRGAISTVEEALKEEARLLRETKMLLDEKTSAQARANAQSRETTQFQTGQNANDIREKLLKESRTMMSVVGEAVSAGGTPDMGMEATTQGYAKIQLVVDTLQDSIRAGVPAFQSFNTEISKVGSAHPEVARTVSELLKVSQREGGGIDLENANRQLRDMQAALDGTADSATRARIGLASVAEEMLKGMMKDQGAAQAERAAQATLQMVEAYGGTSVETAPPLQQVETEPTEKQSNTPSRRDRQNGGAANVGDQRRQAA